MFPTQNINWQWKSQSKRDTISCIASLDYLTPGDICWTSVSQKKKKIEVEKKDSEKDVSSKAPFLRQVSGINCLFLQK